MPGGDARRNMRDMKSLAPPSFPRWMWCAVLGALGLIMLAYFSPWSWRGTGLDTAGHVWMLGEIQEGLRRGEIFSRTTESFWGMPLLRYYHFLPPLAAAALGSLIGNLGALAWMQSLPVAMLPLVVGWAVRRGGASPAAALWAGGAWIVLAYQLPVPFRGTWDGGLLGDWILQFGGTRLSAYAGSYASSWGLLILFVILGFLARPSPRRTIGGDDVALAILLAASVLCQPQLALVAVAASAAARWGRWGRLFFSWCAAGTLFAAWLGPFLLGPFLDAMTHRGWDPSRWALLLWQWVSPFPLLGIPVAALLGALAVTGWRAIGGRRPFVAAGLRVVFLYALFALLPPATIWNQRWIVVWAVLITAGAGLGLYELLRRLPRVWRGTAWCLGGALLVAAPLWTTATAPFIWTSPYVSENYPVREPVEGRVLPRWNSFYNVPGGGRDGGGIFFEQSPAAPFVETVQHGLLAEWALTGDWQLLAIRGEPNRPHLAERGARALGVEYVHIPDWRNITPGARQVFAEAGWEIERGELWRNPRGSLNLASLLRARERREGGSFIGEAERAFFENPEVWVTDGKFPPLDPSCEEPYAREMDHRSIHLRAQEGCPVLVRAGWIPGWRSSDGSPIARAGPFLALNPRSEEIVLTWGRSWDLRASMGVSAAGVPFMAWLFYYLHRRRRRERGEGEPPETLRPQRGRGRGGSIPRKPARRFSHVDSQRRQEAHLPRVPVPGSGSPGAGAGTDRGVVGGAFRFFRGHEPEGGDRQLGA